MADGAPNSSELGKDHQGSTEGTTPKAKDFAETPFHGEKVPNALPLRLELPARARTPLARPVPVRNNATVAPNRNGTSSGQDTEVEEAGYEGDAGDYDEESEIPTPGLNTPTFAHGSSNHAVSPSESSYMGSQKRRDASTDSIFAGRNREQFAKARPFPTPGFRESQCNPMDSYTYKSIEEMRLEEDARKEKHWKRWGPYLSERQWATVREDYSANGDAWSHFPHEQARSRAYRWGEDGIGGFSDNHQRLCFGLALWNEKDPFLKERLFGTSGPQGNHGEDVKEMYYYLDSTPTHSYMRMLYKYPQREYPYQELIRENGQRSREVSEFEIIDTNAFDDDRYWDVFIEYAKDEDNADATSIRITAYNRGPEPADLHIIPQIWFRNTWSWPKVRPTGRAMPSMKATDDCTVRIDHQTLGRYYCHFNVSPPPVPPQPSRRSRSPEPELSSESEETVAPELMFTENETNFARLYNGTNVTPYVKDGFHDHIIHSHRPAMKPSSNIDPKVNEYSNLVVNGHSHHESDDDATVVGEDETPPHSSAQSFVEDESNYINPEKKGTKAAGHYVFKDVPPRGGCAVVRIKLTPRKATDDLAARDDESFDEVVEGRREDSNEFYSRFNSSVLNDDLRNIMRQALAGMLWSKQFYYFVHSDWLHGDAGQPPPPPERKWVRNRNWRHLYIDNILSMPDKWEYPYFAVWDTAFHCISLAMVDPAFAKNQLDVFTREWYMKPDGALPAYEWNFDDVNPPVHAWATFRIFKLERKMYGREDLGFLERVFQKLLINFTWWVNRKDSGGNNVFEGGFLGLDNIGIFNRSEPLPTGGTLRQADGTAWMAFYALNMLNMALELAKHNPTYEDIASKFFEHFLFIADAMTYKDSNDNTEGSLWNDEDGFYYDVIRWGPGSSRQLPIHSLVGLIPLYATLTLEPGNLKRFPGFKRRLEWFIEYRAELASRNIANLAAPGKAERRLLALADEERLRKILHRMLDESEFLSDFGIRSLSRWHKEHPYSMTVNGEEFSVPYWPGDSKSGMFGGNSNWRGPVWLAVNFLLIESLQRFHQYYGAGFKIECPTGSGDEMTLANVADELQHRLIHLFARDHEGTRACNGGSERLNRDPHFRDYLNFHEFFHADNGKGLGASHQTGWTGLVAYMIWQTGHSARLPRTPRTPRSSAAHYFDETIPTTPAATDTGGDSGNESLFGHYASASELSPDEL